ncbi:hypothetical protein, partial [Cyclobacterium qasimii]|uniref:hypothetical protein n=1 Tax=Cyclobacterium qasimii TaxID=1350429 RepID=UPI00058EF2A9
MISSLIENSSFYIALGIAVAPTSCRFVTPLGITNWVKSETGISQGLNIEGRNVFVVDYQLFYVFKWFFFDVG